MNTLSALEDYLKGYAERGSFNGALLLAKDNEVLLQKAMGYASHEYGVKNTTKTKFRIGSITKGFTAMALLILCEKGLVRLEDPIQLYLEDFVYEEPVTIHHLLTHTSGIPNFTSHPSYWATTMRLPTTLQQTVQSIARMPLEFAPGTHYQYSNSGYILLTAIIEKVSAVSYSSFLQEHIWLPLGMLDTGCEESRSVIKGLATGYTVWEEYIHTEYIDMTIPRGAYGMYSTVEDLWKWDQALYTEQLVSAEWIDKMFTPYADHYGYGWAIHHSGGRKITSHFGDINGFQSDLYRSVDDRLVVIALSNVNLTPVTKITRDMAKVAWGEPVEFLSRKNGFLQETADAITQSTGTYIAPSNEGMRVEITAEPHGIFVTHPKMYGVPYKFPLRLAAHTAEYVEWAADMVNETFQVFVSTDQKGCDLLFTDEFGKTEKLFAAAKRS
ncbi:serine hydrolase domain-containing protein [Brevibacillus choshinensis]|uniref:Beta-lactamase family protein n=1 Tax=Brevibacillus choshinensis TaxID=54911 RepID=A0ABX7FLK0_BRECH|nr:serine hydrolase domain-containing protein [Brevibacillus choshinensis]QRG67126.1 beta-lactamase family protein [Brevibacillus choshinensis]